MFVYKLIYCCVGEIEQSQVCTTNTMYCKSNLSEQLYSECGPTEASGNNVSDVVIPTEEDEAMPYEVPSQLRDTGR